MTSHPPAVLGNHPQEHLKVALLPWENEAEFDSLLQAYETTYLPKGPTETGLVEQLAWIDWRRRRLRLGERALHMASLDRATSDQRYDQLTRRSLALGDGTRPELSSRGAVRSDDEADKGSVASWTEMVAAAETAEALIDANGQAAYAQALAGLPDETREWFEEECEGEGQFTLDWEGLKRFLIHEVLPFFRANLAGARGGAVVRLQAWGESLDPVRMDKLLALDERLTRQFEKVLGMLIRLQEMRPRTLTSK